MSTLSNQPNWADKMAGYLLGILIFVPLLVISFIVAVLIGRLEDIMMVIKGEA